MKRIRTKSALIFAMIILSCSNKTEKISSKEPAHGKSVTPNYSIVFPNDKVNRIDIKIDAANWTEMQDDLKSNISSSGRMPPPSEIPPPGVPGNLHQQRMHEGPPPGGFEMRPGMENDSIHSPNRARRMGPPPGGRPGGQDYQPIWANCDILFNNEKWSKVGIRFKGNSSLRSAYQSGIKKLSFKLDFEQFEDEFPEIKNQRFYGFKQLNLKNNYEDQSLIREKVVSDLFAEFGLASPKTSFCQLYVDFGDGPVYFGLYALVEEVDDTVIKTNFSDKSGNLYKPDGFAATFADGSFNKSSMNKKNNTKSQDFSDVQQLYTILNSSLRIENPKIWKSQLSEIFDVPVFLKWLAANTVMQNWDSYGKTFHNYYLYNNPSTHKLEWIPWDNNEAFQAGKMGGALSISLDEVEDDWPLIRYIIDDEEWKAEYKSNVSAFANEVFIPEKMTKIYDNYQQLISGSVIGKQGEQQNYTFLKNESDFIEAIEFLKQHVIERKTAVQEFLDK